MDTHVRNLGRLNIMFGIAGVIMFVATLLFYGGLSELYAAAQADWLVAALAYSVLFHALLAIPSIVLGWAVMTFDNRARPALIVVCALNVLNFPFGSILGAYGLWVLMSPETEPLFFDPPPEIKALHRPRTPAVKPAQEHTPEVKRASILRSRRADAGPQ